MSVKSTRPIGVPWPDGGPRQPGRPQGPDRRDLPAAAPASLAAAVRSAKYLADWHTPLPTQAALADFIDQGLFARHLRRMRSVYQQRHQRIVELLEDHFADHLKPVPSAAGLHVAATAPTSTPEELQAVLGRASAAGVEVQPLSMYDLGPPSQPGIVLGYGPIPTADIDEGLDRLRRCFAG